MRGGRFLLAVAFTLTTTVVCVSQDNKTDSESAIKTANYEFSSQTKSSVRPVGNQQPTQGNPTYRFGRQPVRPDSTPTARKQANAEKPTPIFDQPDQVTPSQVTVIRDRTRRPSVTPASLTRTVAPQQDDEWGELPTLEDAPLFNAAQPAILRTSSGQATPAKPVTVQEPIPSPAPRANPVATAPAPAPSPAELFDGEDKDMFDPLPTAEAPGPVATPTAAPTPVPEVFQQPIRQARPEVPVSAAAFRADPIRPASMATPDAVGQSEAAVPAGPAVGVEVKRRGECSVGHECECSFVVRNSGGSVAGNVILEAYLPKHVRATAVSPRPIDNESLSWTLGELAPGEEKTVSVKLLPETSGEVKVRAFVRYSGQTVTSFEAVQPMLNVTVAGPKQVHVGEAASHVITVANPGSGVARDVVIAATIPKGLQHRNGENLSLQIGSLSPGESRKVRLALTAMDAGSHSLTVNATAGDLKDSAESRVAVVAPKLELEIVGPKVRHAGRRGRYTLVVTNTGQVITSNVRAKYRVPAGFEFIEADHGGRLNTGDNTVEWFVGQLQANESGRFNVLLRAKQLGDFSHDARVVSEQGTSSSAKLATRIAGVSSLALTIQDRDDPVEVGQETMYEVRVSNEGSKDANAVELICELPAGMELNTVRGPANYFKRNGNIVFEKIPRVAPGKTVVFQLIVKAKNGGGQKFRARLASDSGEPLISEEVTKVYAD